MDRSSLRWKAQEVSWASQSCLEMAMFDSTKYVISLKCSELLIIGIVAISPDCNVRVGFTIELNIVTMLVFKSPSA